MVSTWWRAVVLRSGFNTEVCEHGREEVWKETVFIFIIENFLPQLDYL